MAVRISLNPVDPCLSAAKPNQYWQLLRSSQVGFPRHETPRGTLRDSPSFLTISPNTTAPQKPEFAEKSLPFL